MVVLAKRLGCEEESQHQLGRLPVFHLQLGPRVKHQEQLVLLQQ